MSDAAPRLRIAVLNRAFSPQAGGAERYSVALVQQLAGRHEVHVFAQSFALAGVPPPEGVTYHPISLPLSRPRWINQLWFAIATWRATRAGNGAFDAVHSHENTWHGQIQTVHVLPVRHNLFHGRTGVRLAWRWLRVLTSPRLVVYLALEARRYAVQPGRRVVVTSDSLRQVFCAAYPKARTMVSVITPGLVLPPLPDASARQDARQELGLPPDAQCILFVGNDFRKKGLQTLIESLQLLRAASPARRSVVAVVGGAAQQLPQFQAQAAKAGVSEDVFFLGSLSDVGPAYRAADCLAHPTREDTFAMVVLEAMGYGLPVVVSPVEYCGISGLLTDRVDALVLADPHDAPALATALRQLRDTPQLCAGLGTAARQFAGRHQWDAVAEQHERLYSQAAAQSKPA